MMQQQVTAELPSNRPCRRRNRGIDWLAIEPDYRAGVLSLRALGQKHGCSHSTIVNFASRHGWDRNARVEKGGTESVPDVAET